MTQKKTTLATALQVLEAKKSESPQTLPKLITRLKQINGPQAQQTLKINTDRFRKMVRTLVQTNGDPTVIKDTKFTGFEIENSATPFNKEDQDLNLAHLAVAIEDTALLNALLDHQALAYLFEERDSFNRKPIHLAAQFGDQAMFQRILQKYPKSLQSPETSDFKAIPDDRVVDIERFFIRNYPQGLYQDYSQGLQKSILEKILLENNLANLQRHQNLFKECLEHTLGMPEHIIASKSIYAIRACLYRIYEKDRTLFTDSAKLETLKKKLAGELKYIAKPAQQETRPRLEQWHKVADFPRTKRKQRAEEIIAKLDRYLFFAQVAAKIKREGLYGDKSFEKFLDDYNRITTRNQFRFQSAHHIKKIEDLAKIYQMVFSIGEELVLIKHKATTDLQVQAAFDEVFDNKISRKLKILLSQRQELILALPSWCQWLIKTAEESSSAKVKNPKPFSKQAKANRAIQRIGNGAWNPVNHFKLAHRFRRFGLPNPASLFKKAPKHPSSNSKT